MSDLDDIRAALYDDTKRCPYLWCGYRDEEHIAGCPIPAARAALDSVISELAKLDHNRCNSGHETLPLRLWECPVCTEERVKAARRAALEEVREAVTMETFVCPACRGDGLDQERETCQRCLGRGITVNDQPLDEWFRALLDKEDKTCES